jgi:hypothetical protein
MSTIRPAKSADFLRNMSLPSAEISPERTPDQIRPTQEIDPGSDAATEIEGLWNWLCAELHLGTLALVHRSRR